MMHTRGLSVVLVLILGTPATRGDEQGGKAQDQPVDRGRPSDHPLCATRTSVSGCSDRQALM
jgi:hypothetical protein